MSRPLRKTKVAGKETHGHSESHVSDSISPAALAIIAGALFSRNGNIEEVETCYPSGHNPKANVIIICTCDCNDNVGQKSRTAIQVRDLEEQISAGNVDVLIGRNASEYNSLLGWNRERHLQSSMQLHSVNSEDSRYLNTGSRGPAS